MPIPEQWLDRIDEAIAWRGPDGAGRFRDLVVKEDGTTVEVALVHRRLSIIDHDGGAQPMVSEQGRLKDDGTREGLVAVVFNGCIYNHRELRAELEERGHVFETGHSDTEVLIHLHREHRIGAVTGTEEDEYDEWNRDQKCDGMISSVVWDAEHASLAIQRDWFLEKPLYFQQSEHGDGVFASSPTGIWNGLIGSDREHWAAELPSLVAQGFPTRSYGFRLEETVLQAPLIPTSKNRSLYQGCLDGFGCVLGTIAAVLFLIGFVYVLAKFTILIVPVLGGAIIWWVKLPLWHGALSAPIRAVRGHGLRASSERIDTMLTRAVASRLEADVPLGCLLSGGVDSSLVAHYAMEELGQLTTISVRMPDEQYDESRYAELVAEHLGTDHHTIDVHPEPAKDLIHLIGLIGLPFGDSSLLPTYWACKAASEHVKVVLTGDGADELFYGYERYRAMRSMDWARLAARFVNTEKYDRSDPKSRESKLARFFEAARGDGYLDLVSIFPRAEAKKLFGDEAVLKAQRVWSIRGARNWDLRNYLPEDLLRKTDTASMAAGIELRAPFLARELADHARKLPIATLMPGGKCKGLLKHIAYQHLPPEIIDRPKMGFAIPVGEWFRDDFGGMRTLMMDTLTRTNPFGPCHDVMTFNMDYVRQMIHEHDERVRDHSQRLYMLTVLGVWADTLS